MVAALHQSGPCQSLRSYLLRMAASGRRDKRYLGGPRVRRGRALSRGQATARPSPQAVSAHSGHDHSAKKHRRHPYARFSNATIRTGALVSPACCTVAACGASNKERGLRIVNRHAGTSGPGFGAGLSRAEGVVFAARSWPEGPSPWPTNSSRRIDSVHVLALEFVMDDHPVRLGLTAMALLRPGCSEQPRLQRRIGHVIRRRQLRPAGAADASVFGVFKPKTETQSYNLKIIRCSSFYVFSIACSTIPGLLRMNYSPGQDLRLRNRIRHSCHGGELAFFSLRQMTHSKIGPKERLRPRY